LGYQETVKKFLLNQTCHRVTENILEQPVQLAPPNITWLSMEILLISVEEARFCLNNPLVTPFFLTYGDREFLTFREASITYGTTFEQPQGLSIDYSIVDNKTCANIIIMTVCYSNCSTCVNEMQCDSRLFNIMVNPSDD
jgi:hypothetical protein